MGISLRCTGITRRNGGRSGPCRRISGRARLLAYYKLKRTMSLSSSLAARAYGRARARSR
jgi:hypothetical protein